jgi:putative 4-mercaptohistidine N1-methyltranferase
VDVQGGEVVLGKREDPTFGWDNEFGERRVRLAPFKASRMLVSNAEYLRFVTAGGYSTDRWWSQEGLAWREYSRARMPTFWIGSPDDPDELGLRLMTEAVPMRWDWPVEVNALEAAAFCRWKSDALGQPVQLPSEAEWACLRARVSEDQPSWRRAPGNCNLEYWASSCPVDRFAQGEFFDILGNAWQWTSTPIEPYEGFKVHPLYDDFSTPTFDAKHNLMKGGSWISTGNEALRWSRYAFRRHFFQHAGLRYVVSNNCEPPPVDHYESNVKVAQYAELHYGAEYFGVPSYPCSLAQIAIELCPRGGRALDLGCSVGRASFELARHFDRVDAIDMSVHHLEVGMRLASCDHFRYVLPTEGELQQYREIRLSALGLEPEQIARVSFSQGDALNLKPHFKGYDLVLAANLLDHLREPARFLREIGQRMNAGAVLMVTCPYTWRTEFTPKENWLGGVHTNGEAVTSERSIHRLLAEMFEEIAPARDIPLVIYETARKFEHILTQLTVWRRKASQPNPGRVRVGVARGAAAACPA